MFCGLWQRRRQRRPAAVVPRPRHNPLTIPPKRPRCYLLEIPPEIRLLIYEAYFSERCLTLAIEGDYVECRWEIPLREFLGETKSATGPALLRTCSTIHDEAKPVLCARTWFMVNFGYVAYMEGAYGPPRELTSTTIGSFLRHGAHVWATLSYRHEDARKQANVDLRRLIEAMRGGKPDKRFGSRRFGLDIKPGWETEEWLVDALEGVESGWTITYRTRS